MKRPGSKKHGTKKFLGVIMAVGIIAAGTYAFTAGNTVPASNAGDGESVGGVTGYTVSNLDYNENLTNPDLIDSVDFMLSGSADRVRVQLEDAGSWYSCVPDFTLDATGALLTGVLNSWECATTTPQATAAAVDQFRVLAYEDNNDAL